MNDVTVDEEDLGYFGWERLDAVERIPTTAKRVLTLGCGGAATERHLVERGVHVVGFEQDPRAVAVAEKHGIEIRQHDLDRGVELGDDRFDAVLLLDVLEHLRDPEQVLRDCVDHMPAGATVIISVPNFRNYTILWGLGAKGGVEYVDAGILDRTHIRLTTRRMVRDWFAATGVEEVECRHTMHKRRERLVSRFTFGLLDDILASQVMLVGRVRG